MSSGREAWIERQLRPEQIADPRSEAAVARFPAYSADPAELLRAFPRQGAKASARPAGDTLHPPRSRRARPTADAMAQEMTDAMRTGSGMRPSPRAGARKANRRRAVDDSAQARRPLVGRPAQIATDLVGAKLARAVATERQVEDVMADFWFNHFNVYWGKGPVRYLVGDYERNAIRPYVFGRFEEMLRATAQHPAMLLYLDNASSVAPDTATLAARRARQALDRWRVLKPDQREAAVRDGRVTAEQARRLTAAVQRTARTPGLNENYARELLELHTLGVDGGYEQADVVNVARAFTGWSVARGPHQRPAPGGSPSRRNRRTAATAMAGRGPGAARMRYQAEPSFVFRPEMHDRGAKTVLGRALPAGRGRDDGDEVLAMLARHPATARHLATKLVRRFVADEPPPALVDHLTAVYLRTDGNLREVTRALLTAGEFYAPRHREAKVKTPLELVASGLRATGATLHDARGVANVLRGFGHLPYASTAPTGYPSASEAWTNSGAMLSRMNFGLALASGRVPGVSAPAAAPGSPLEVEVVIAEVMPGTRAPVLVQAVRADLQAQSAAPAARAARVRALGLVLGSPQFQRR